MEGEIDYSKIYMTKIDHRHTRVGKEYQAVIPEFKPRAKKEGSTKSGSNTKEDLKQLTIEHKARYDNDIEEKTEEEIKEIPNKKRKIDDK